MSYDVSNYDFNIATNIGIADGWEFEFRLPELLRGFLTMINNKN